MLSAENFTQHAKRLTFISSPGALLQVTYAMTCCPSVRPSLAFHIFDISSRTISWIELKLKGRHCGNMEIQNSKNRSVPISKMAAILKFFKRHLLPNHMFDWAETWWEASQWHRFRIAKIVPFQEAAILKFFKRHLLPNRKSDWAKAWWEASQWHRDSELLKSFRSKMAAMAGDRLEIL